MLISLNINIYGMVQNVGFRYYTNKKARVLGINGFVKNMPDGSVYVEAEGEADIMDTFLEFCEKGPSWSRVDKINVQEAPEKNFGDFRIR
ncbi:MAG: acylphosphatase [Bacteroidota bacterium]|nr:acylphosphatase [Bacteroidota bacterium]